MNKYHINKHGVPAVCRARSGNCPLGGDEQHFNSEQEAQEYANKVNEERYQMLPEVNNEDYIDEKYLPFYDKVLEHDNFDSFARQNAKDIVKSKMFPKESVYEDSLQMWKDVHYHNSAKELHKVSDEEAIQVIQDNIRPSALSGWFRNYDSNYKPEIEQVLITNPEVRNASMNIAHRVYQESTGEQIEFDDFLNKEIEVYRGGNFSFIEKDVFISYSMDKKIAEKFAGNGGQVKSITIKIKDTLGSLQTDGEAELMIPVGKIIGP